MARSFLRENQIKDEHLLTEQEHEDFDHTTLSGIVSDHSELNDDEPEKHRVINDDSTTSTDLWSAEKIDAMLTATGAKFIYQDHDPDADDGNDLDVLLQTTTGDFWKKDDATYGSDQCNGGTASGRPSYAVQVNEAFDNNTDTYCQLQTTTDTWIQYQFTAAKQIMLLKLYGNEGSFNYWPDEFYLYASNTGSFSGEEVELTHETGITSPSDKNIPQEYSFINENSYTYYRIVCPSGSGGGGGFWVQFSEIEMMEVDGFSWQKIWENTHNGYTGNFEVITAISGSDYTKATLYFDDGILTTVSGVTQVQGDSYLLL